MYLRAPVASRRKGSWKKDLSREGSLNFSSKMRVLTDTQSNKRSFRMPAGVNLRECSVVIIGSTCRICGRDFKCESDVALHRRWRHLAIESLINGLRNESYGEIGCQKCNICNMYLETVSDLRIHKRQVHRHRKRPQTRTVRVRFKLNGITMTDVTLDRKYLKVQSMLRYFVDVATQTESHENKKRQDNCVANIDLSLHATDNTVRCDIRSHKAANRYIVRKFASTARSAVMMGRSLGQISNRDATSGNNGIIYVEKGNSCDIVPHEDRTDSALVVSLVNNMNIQDKENSRTINARERRNVYCQSEISFSDDLMISPTRQRDDNNIISAPICKHKSRSRKNLCRSTSIKQPNKSAKHKLNNTLVNSMVDIVDIDESNNNFNNVRVTMKRSSVPFRLGDKNVSAKVNTSDDDNDVQEVLRIIRGNVRNDINHESPNRTEREILVQNAVDEMYRFPMRHRSNVHRKKRSAELEVNDIESSRYSSFTPIAEGNCQFQANELNTKLSDICLKDLHLYGINYYNDLPEINNNYAMYVHD